MIHDALVSSTDPNNQEKLQRLNAELGEYYNRPQVAEYYRIAHSINETWSPNSYHAIVQSMVNPGASVVDLGCGSGHAYLNLKDRGVHYTGVDWSAQQIEQNARNYGTSPHFVAAPLYSTGLPSNSYDLCFSFFVLEHLVWPHLFLKEMVRLTKPGGWVVILCPEFRSLGRIPSFPYGKSVKPLSQKVKDKQFADAAIHAFQRCVYYPWVVRRYPRDKYPFLINLKPSCLQGSYYADNDAVYLVDRMEVAAALTQMGMADATREKCQQSGLSVDKTTMLTVARKLESGPPNVSSASILNDSMIQ